MSNWEELDNAINVFKKNSNLCVLQCTSMYPTPPDKVGLNVLLELKKRYNITTSKLINNKKIFPIKIYKKYLTHEDYDDFKGLKFWKAIKWKIGNAIIWDRSIIHSSNNFLKHKAYSKIGLSIFLNRK